ncbi:MAG TPA: alpha/beta fold hydrolase [Candidatus Hydrogenedentes bacterium]|nr:alpha/beta fold hydrolase [Candidatus Hydrogenedentota bacterium]
MKKRLLIGCGGLTAVLALSVAIFVFLLVDRAGGHYFNSNGARIYYTDEGAGEPVILIHGIGANADLNWRRPGVTRALAKHFRVIAFDLRGHGLSDKPAEPEQYGVQMVEDVPRLMDHLGIDQAHVAGYSLGGFLLQRLLVLHPDRVRSAAICAAGWKDPEDPTPIPSPYKSPEDQPKPRSLVSPLRVGERWGGSGDLETFGWASGAVRRPATTVATWAQPRALHAAILPLADSKSLFHRARSWIGDQFMSRPVKKALKATYPELAVYEADLEAIRTPTLCIIGDRDGFRFLAEDLRLHMDGLEFVEVPGANHFTLPFFPRFKRDLVRFLTAHAMTNAAAVDPLPAKAETAPPPETVLKVLTWNIQMLPATFGAIDPRLDKMQAIRAPWIIEYLNQSDYDVLCLQEVLDTAILDQLEAGLKTVFPHVVPPQYAADGRAFSNGVLFMSRVPIRYVAHVVFEDLSRIEMFTSKGCCLVEGEKDGIPFLLAGTHFPTGKQAIKDKAVTAIAERLLGPHRREGVPVILAGDFNTAKGSQEYGELLRITETTDFPVDDPRPYSSDSRNSWKTDKPRKLSLIDHVLLDPRGTATAFSRIAIQRPTREYEGRTIDLADHYGVIGEFVLRK